MVSKVIAVLLGVAGLLGRNPFLLFIAFFIYMGVQGETRQSHTICYSRPRPGFSPISNFAESLRENHPNLSGPEGKYVAKAVEIKGQISRAPIPC